MRTIYIDVLLILNLYVNWLILRGTARLTHTRLTGLRCIAASAAGSLTSLTIMLPELHPVLTLIIKLFTAAVPVAAAFGLSRQKTFWRCLAVFFSISFVFAGLCLALCTLSGTNLLIWSSSCIYVHFSLTSLILCTALSYLLLRIFSYVKMKYFHSDEVYEIIVRIGIHTAIAEGLADTGNSLTDCFTGLPVIICGKNILSSLPEISDPYKLRGYKLIPYATVSGEGLLPVFHPDEVIIRSRSTGRIRSADVLIGITDEQNTAIFNPNLFHVL
ncbi:MAG: sigma-E processing peptidase SpoIIGA [Oscillospiraceae bacterium]|nr:sigma-E processing peptidase SpoIIGA [Oscillospiraceae bacterium]